jgi:formamidopyrimidine-DNA glycosylase
MPELPEVEVLVRHLRPLLRHRSIQSVEVRRSKVISPTSEPELRRALVDSRFTALARRGKYLVFSLQHRRQPGSFNLLGHLGMTGRIYLQDRRRPLPRHTAVVLSLGEHQLVFEDTRYFGRLTLDLASLNRLGPEPLSRQFTTPRLAAALHRSAQPVKVKLLDQSLVAGIGNIYASEALFHARLHPELPARTLTPPQIRGLRTAIRRVLTTAIRWGSTVPLDWAGTGPRDGLFYYGRPKGTPNFRKERLRVYDRFGQPCRRCQTAIRQITQAGRSTFFCPHCQSPSPIEPTAPQSESRAPR